MLVVLLYDSYYLNLQAKTTGSLKFIASMEVESVASQMFYDVDGRYLFFIRMTDDKDVLKMYGGQLY